MFVYTAADPPICFDTGISEEDVKRGFDTLGFKPEHGTCFSRTLIATTWAA
jgi:hypothetical protein